MVYFLLEGFLKLLFYYFLLLLFLLLPLDIVSTWLKLSVGDNSHSKASPSSCSLKGSLFGRTSLITLYNVAKLPLGFVETVPDG